LDLVQPDQFDPPTQKPYPGSGTKHEVDRMIGCGDIADFLLARAHCHHILLPADVLVTDSES